MKEIYWNSESSMMLCEELDDGNVFRFCDLPRSLIIHLDRKIEVDYPDEHETLCNWRGTGNEYAYARVYQFCACNFSAKDGYPDIDDDMNFITEKVSCPVRHTCKFKICNPQLSTKLSARQIEIISLYT